MYPSTVEIDDVIQFHALLESNPYVVASLGRFQIDSLLMKLSEFEESADLEMSNKSPIPFVVSLTSASSDILHDAKITAELPAIILFGKNSYHVYDGDKESTNITRWVNSITRRSEPYITEKYLDKLMSKYANGWNVLIAFLNNTENNNAFTEVAYNDYNDHFGIINEQSVWNHYKEFLFDKKLYAGEKLMTVDDIKLGSVLLMNGVENKVYIFPDFISDLKKFKEFVSKYQNPLIYDFNLSTAPRLFSDSRFICFLVDPYRMDSQLSKDFLKIAEVFRGKLLFSVSGIEERHEMRLLDMLSAREETFPIIRIYGTTTKNDRVVSRRFKSKDDVSPLNYDSMRSFIEDFLDNKLMPYFLSEPLPDNPYDGPVRVCVGLNFKKVVLDSPEHVLVLFHAPWCGFCRKLYPDYKTLAILMQSARNLIFVMVDATRNEIEDMEITHYPLLMLFLSGKKNSPLEYLGDRSVLKMASFVNQFAKLNLDLQELQNASILDNSINKGTLLDEEL